jgi:L,D-transpeptidase ErfK/SrfK
MQRMRYALLILLPLGLLASAASAAEYWVPQQDEVFGEDQVVAARYEDTFVALARTYNVGYEALRRANPGVDPWLPGEGTKVVIPTRFVLPRAPHRGIVVNVAELRLYYFPADAATSPEGTPVGSRRVITHPISIGKMDWSTPLGTTSITSKVLNPPWTPPQSIRAEHEADNNPLPRVVPPGPDNPLGKHALRLGLAGGYLIHGTNKPSGVGMRVTHGCIRMFPEDIEALFKTVPVGTPVTIVNQPYKLGWTADGLYLEAHPPLVKAPAADTEEIDEPSTADAKEPEPVVAEASLTDLTRAYVAATETRKGDVRWDLAEAVATAARGVPELVSVAVPVPVTESFAADPAAATP